MFRRPSHTCAIRAMHLLLNFLLYKMRQEPEKAQWGGMHVLHVWEAYVQFQACHDLLHTSRRNSEQ